MASAAVAAAAAASAAAHVQGSGGNFFGSAGTDGNDFDNEVQVLTGQFVIGVESNVVVGDFGYAGDHGAFVGHKTGHHTHFGFAGSHDGAVYFEDFLFVEFAVRFFGGNDYVEVISGFMSFELFFHAGDEILMTVQVFQRLFSRFVQLFAVFVGQFVMNSHNLVFGNHIGAPCREFAVDNGPFNSRFRCLSLRGRAARGGVRPCPTLGSFLQVKVLWRVLRSSEKVYLLFAFISIVVFLLSASALYVAAEFATVSVKKVKIEALAERGSYFAGKLLPYIENANSLDRYVATCQIGITICSLVLGYIAERCVTPYLHPLLLELGGEMPFGLSSHFWYSALSVAIIVLFTLLQLFFGELLPKAVAVRYTEKVALYLTLPMIWSLKFFGVFISIFNGSSELLLRWLGVPLESQRHAHSPEELSSLVERSDDIDATEQKFIENVLRFDTRIARDIMVPRSNVQCIDVATPREEILEMVVKSTHTRFPVYEGSEDNIIGILHLKKLLHADLKGQKLSDPKKSQAALKKMMMHNVVYCPSSLGVDTVLEKLRASRAYMAVLEDEYGGTEGILTIEDILEEVLGEINDEFDPQTQQTDEDIREIKPGEYIVKGSTNIDDLAENYDVVFKLDDEHAKEVHTVGGLVMHLAEAVPRVGTVVRCRNYSFVVLEMNKRQVMKVRLKRQDGQS